MVTMPKFENFPSFDLSGLDASRLAETNEKLVAAVRDAAYVTVGFGVLALQQAQVRRREMVRGIATRFGTSKTQVEQMLAKFETQFAKLDARVVAICKMVSGGRQVAAACVGPPRHAHSAGSPGTGVTPRAAGDRPPIMR